MDKNQFLNLYGMMMADGIMHPNELAELYRIGMEHFGLTPAEINETVKDGGYNTEVVVPESPADRLQLLYDMAVIAWADGEIQSDEKELLKRYAKEYGMDETLIEQFVDYLLEQVKDKVSFDDLLEQLKDE